MEGPQQINPCGICLGVMFAGAGQAIFTAECSHMFHLNCISTSVAQGRLVCPLCNAQWRELPSVRPSPLPSAMPPTLPRQPFPRMEPMHGVQPTLTWQQPPFLSVQPPPLRPPEPEVFDDDDQVDPPASDHDGQRVEPAATSSGPLVIKTPVEYSSVPRHSSPDNFAVLVHVKAPAIADTEAEAAGDAPRPRAPLDLVTVLDVSGSMRRRDKLALVKQAMGFVIEHLGTDDRLSVVSFSSVARRVTRLLRMSDIGKGIAMEAVESLTAGGGTNIADGLRMAAKVLDERRHRNAVSSVILLSDGKDNHTVRRVRGSVTNYETLVPPSFVVAGDWSAPIHTFGFGNDHDAAAMHVVAEATGGTFSYVENEAVIQDAFAQCVGGLLTVVAQEARLAIATGHPGVRIVSVKSGRYESRVDEDGRSASIAIGELYADEERRFLLFLSVPKAEASDGETATPLIRVRCSYRDAAGGAHVEVTAEDTAVARPEHAADVEERSPEVERERVRVEAIEDMAAARAAAERGEHQTAVEILGHRRRALSRLVAARGGDPASAALGTEVRRMCKRVATRESYRASGRAYVLAGLSSHHQQRAVSRQLMPLRQEMEGSGGGGGEATSSMAVGDVEVGDVDTGLMEHFVGGGRLAGAAGASVDEADATASYLTPAMRAMLLRSRRAREATAEQQQPKAAEEAGSSESKEVLHQ